jgi:hypothetical protein
MIPRRSIYAVCYLEGALYAGPNDGQQAPLNPGQDCDRVVHPKLSVTQTMYSTQSVTWRVHSTRAPVTGNRLLSTRDRMVTGSLLAPPSSA